MSFSLPLDVRQLLASGSYCNHSVGGHYSLNKPSQLVMRTS